MNRSASLGLAAAFVLAGALAEAQVRSSANFGITVDQINSGGGAASSTNYLLRGSIGQPFDTVAMSSANYALRPGFQSASPAPYLSISPASLTFGNEAVGASSSAQAVTLTNQGNVSIAISSIGTTGTNAGDFVPANGCGSTLAVAASCQVNVVFSPTAGGARSASLSISHSASASAQTVALSGTGITPGSLQLSAGSIDFGTRALGSPSSAQSVTLTNNGGASVTVQSITVGGTHPADFALQSSSCSPLPRTLAGGQTCTFGVVFTASAPGLRNASLTVQSDASGSPHVVALSGRGGKAFGDFDGDGRSDIAWRNATTGENYVYPMNGTAILASEGFTRTVADQNWQVVGLGDFNGDGKADILWRNSVTGENYIYFMNGTAILASEGYIRQVADQSWQVAGVGDFDGDGKDDILWRNFASGENYIYPMEGLAIKAAEGYIRTVTDQKWTIAGVGDLDGDGKADVLWRNTFTGENYVYPMNGTSILGSEGYTRTVGDRNWQVAGVGDFDGDGKADILWRNVSTGENYVYPMNGTAILASEGYIRTVADQNWQVKGVGDYDGDGKADVLWRNVSTGENYVYPMNATTILATEGYVRTVADQNWKPRRLEAVAVRSGPVDGAQAGTASSGTGTTRMAMNLLTREISGFVTYSGLSGVLDAHIHVGATGVSGGVIVPMSQVDANNWKMPATATMPAANFLDYLNGNTYVNVHTGAFPGGEIRGQLQ